MPTSGIPLKLGGTDPTSAMGGFDVYVRKDGGAETLWRTGVPPGRTSYRSVAVGHSYAFRVVPRDLAGNPGPEVVTRSVPVKPALKIVTKPRISGTPKVGSTLQVSTGTWTRKDVRLTYQWFLGTTRITGATKPSITLTRAMRGKTISVKVTGRVPTQAPVVVKVAGGTVRG